MMKKNKKSFLKNISLDSLVSLARNPQHLIPSQMNALVRTIKEDGFLAPILVRPLGKNQYEILSGNHRAMAAREAGLLSIPCLVASLSTRRAKKIAVSLNTIHGDPDPYLLTPFLADMMDEDLRTVYLNDSLLSDVLSIDQELSDRLKNLQLPDALDTDSMRTSIPHQKKCPTCHQWIKSAPAPRTLKSE